MSEKLLDNSGVQTSEIHVAEDPVIVDVIPSAEQSYNKMMDARYLNMVLDSTKGLVIAIEDLLRRGSTQKIGRVPLIQGFVQDETGDLKEADFTIDFNNSGERVYARNVKDIFATLTEGPGINMDRVIHFREYLIRLG